MEKTYHIQGMTCGSCAQKVEAALINIPDVHTAKVDKSTDTAQLKFQHDLPIDTLKNALLNLHPKYSIEPINNSEHLKVTQSWLSTYKPILLVFGYITLITLSIQMAKGQFLLMEWMRHFMAGFFLIFSFFKMLDLSGFADSYQGYDIIAKKWRAWGFAYAFIELSLGLSYLLNWYPLLTNTIAFTIMTISIVGVLQSVFQKKEIQCACLGNVFNLPMSTVTIIEDALMILMSGAMISYYI